MARGGADYGRGVQPLPGTIHAEREKQCTPTLTPRRSSARRWTRSPSSSSSCELLHGCSSSSRWRHSRLPRERITRLQRERMELRFFYNAGFITVSHSTMLFQLSFSILLTKVSADSFQPTAHQYQISPSQSAPPFQT
jgi:hypothetical protein